MVGAVITFVAVCAVVTVYMTIVHSFLRAAEEPADTAREELLRKSPEPREPVAENSQQARWAH
jgi:hypothetical protein